MAERPETTPMQDQRPAPSDRPSDSAFFVEVTAVGGERRTIAGVIAASPENAARTALVDLATAAGLAYDGKPLSDQRDELFELFERVRVWAGTATTAPQRQFAGDVLPDYADYQYSSLHDLHTVLDMCAGGHVNPLSWESADRARTRMLACRCLDNHFADFGLVIDGDALQRNAAKNYDAGFTSLVWLVGWYLRPGLENDPSRRERMAFRIDGNRILLIDMMAQLGLATPASA
jgi:hypothetical protein